MDGVSGRQHEARRTPADAQPRGAEPVKAAHDQGPRRRLLSPDEADLRPDTHTQCTGPNCGADIVWTVTDAGKRMPLNPEPSPDGNVILRTDDHGQIRAHVLTGSQLPAQVEAWVPHHRTCVDSADYRRRRRATTARCRVCRDPLDPWLPEHGYDSHIGCLPPIDIRAAVNLARKASA